MRDRLGIGFGLEGVAVRFQTLAQLLIVFNDAVMYDRNLALAVAPTQMWVRVAVGRLAMRRPTGMSDAAGARQLALLANFFLKVCNTATRLDYAQTVLRERCNARGVIAAVFQTVQTFYQNRQRILAPRETNDSTHIR